MRKFNLISLFFVLLPLTFLFTSCQKDTPFNKSEKSSLSEKIVNWLDKQKLAYGHRVNELNETGRVNSNNNQDIIELIKQNLLFEKANVEIDEKTINYIAVPISDNIKNHKKVDRNSTLHLILILDSKGVIRTGNILYFIPSDGKKRVSLSSNTFRNVLYEKPAGDNGIYKLLSITGRWISQIQIKDGKQYSLGFIRPNGTTGRSQIQRTNGCIDWYLVTTYYYTDGTSETTRDYVGTTCEGCDNGELVSLCRNPDSDGGGGEDIQEEDIEEKVGSSEQTFNETNYSQNDFATSFNDPVPYSFRSSVGYVYNLA